jgi:hypothetical protein
VNDVGIMAVLDRLKEQLDQISCFSLAVVSLQYSMSRAN